MNVSKAITDCWNRFKKENKIKSNFVGAWSFGDSPELAEQLLKLVLTGKKTGTATLVIELEKEGDKMPKVGDYNIILDGKGKPAAIIQTTSVKIKPFNQVKEAYAYSEGEDDRTLESWKREHWKYWTRKGKKLGFTMKENLPVICENFKLVYPR
jgi:uncharacterized protein YhfF